MSDFFSFFLNIWESIEKYYTIFTNSTFFKIIEFILILYITILIVDIILIIYLDGFRKRLRMQFKGANTPLLSKKKKQKEWNIIKKYLETGDENKYKLAIIEADSLLDKHLTEAGYKGATVVEKVSIIPKHFSANIDAVIEFHNLRNEIIKNEDLSLSKEKAEEGIDKMEKLLKTLDIL